MLLATFFTLTQLCFVCFCSDSSMSSLQIPGLGRPFSLGALYDVRQDALVAPGVKLWSQKSLENVFEQDMPNTDAAIVAGSSFDDKANSLNVQAELKASFLSGLVKVSGAANYLHDTASSNYEAQVGFRYHRRTHMKELTMDQLAHVDYPNVFDTATEATHVVTRIEYGANAVFRFSTETNKYEEKEKVEGKLALDIQMIFGQISGSGALNLTDQQKHEYSSFSCKFLGDVNLPEPPTTFIDAVNAFKHLPPLITKNSSIPIVVYLYPLSKLDSKALRIVRRISAELLTEVDDRMNSYDDLSRSVGDLRHKAAYQELPLFENQIDAFESALNLHRNQLQSKLLEVLPQIRGAGMAEIELAKALDESNTRFTMEELKRWVQWRQMEAGALDTLTTWRPDAIVSKPGAFEQMLFNTSIKYIVSFTLTLYQETDPFTECVKRNCDFNVTNYFCQKLNCEKTAVINSWMQNRTLSYLFRSIFSKYQRVLQFNDQILAVGSGRMTAFIIREQAVVKNGQKIAVEVYKDGMPIDDDFHLPTLEELKMQDRYCNGSTLSWKFTPESASPLVGNSFIVQYRSSDAKDWNSVQVPQTKTFVSLYDDFVVVVGAICEFGVCADLYEVFENNEDLDCALAQRSDGAASKSSAEEIAALKKEIAALQAQSSKLTSTVTSLTNQVTSMDKNHMGALKTLQNEYSGLKNKPTCVYFDQPGASTYTCAGNYRVGFCACYEPVGDYRTLHGQTVNGATCKCWSGGTRPHGSCCLVFP